MYHNIGFYVKEDNQVKCPVVAVVQPYLLIEYLTCFVHLLLEALEANNDKD